MKMVVETTCFVIIDSETILLSHFDVQLGLRFSILAL